MDAELLAQRLVERRSGLDPPAVEVELDVAVARRRGVQRWFFTSANPGRAGMPAARAAAVSTDDFPTQNPAPFSSTALARNVAGSRKSQYGV